MEEGLLVPFCLSFPFERMHTHDDDVVDEVVVVDADVALRVHACPVSLGLQEHKLLSLSHFTLLDACIYSLSLSLSSTHLHLCALEIVFSLSCTHTLSLSPTSFYPKSLSLSLTLSSF